MDRIEKRGLAVALACQIIQKNGIWVVPSQSGKGLHVVHLNTPNGPICTCPNFGNTTKKCKHIHAVEFTILRKEHPQKFAQLEKGIEEDPPRKPTYKQVWPAYNAAQTMEKERFLPLLYDLCQGIDEPPPKPGRPCLRLADILFAVCFKVFSTVSGRRFMSDFRDAKEKGYVSSSLHFNSISGYLQKQSLSPLLTSMIIESSAPLSAVEEDFACDSSGFTSSQCVNWIDHKEERVRRRHTWVKAHIMCGVRTNVITAVEIWKREANDMKLLPDLVGTTAQRFTMKEVSADKGYTSRVNHIVIDGYGATPYLAFKVNHKGRGGGIWKKMFHLFHFKRDEFLQHYHKRSNVESTFSMVKRKFGDHVRSRLEVAMKNEVLAKFVCHNICCLIQETYELGIEPKFWIHSTAVV